MSTPLLRTRRVLAAQLESAVGTAETLTADDAAFNVFDADLQPGADFQERPGQAGHSPLKGVLGRRSGTCNFAVEAHGSGVAESAGGESVPAWAKVFLPACGMKQAAADSPVFNVSSTSPTGGATAVAVRTITLGLFEDGLFKVLSGCMGNVSVALVAGEKAMLNFEFSGVWAAPTDVALIAPDYPSVLPPRFAGGAVTYATKTPVLSEMTIDVGNNVVLRPDATQAAGIISALITGRRTTVSMNPETNLVATHDKYGAWLASTEGALSAALGAGADGNTLTFGAPAAQISEIKGGDRDGVAVDEVSLQCNRSADAGDDEFTITFS